jgi:organic radical activating enzyme
VGSGKEAAKDPLLPLASSTNLISLLSSHAAGSDDFKGEELVNRVLALLDSYMPLHVSLVGGDPLVRYRELEQLISQIEDLGVHTQVVTSSSRYSQGMEHLLRSKMS